MKKIGALLITCFVVAVALSMVRVDTAQARSTYAKAFKAKYIGEEETDAQKTLAAEVTRVKTCNVCHDPRPGESGKPDKKNRNPYGQTLAKLLSEKDQKDQDKATKMLAKIEAEKVKDAKKTFGELLKSGKVPFEYEEEKE